MKDIISLPIVNENPDVDSKYRLAVLASQRAVQIAKGSQPRSECSYRKPTSVALVELEEGKVPFFSGEEAVKARERDEEMYKQVLAEVRATYEDEEGNLVFGEPRAPMPAPPSPPAPV